MRNLRKVTIDSKVKVVKNADGVLTLRLLGVGFGDKEHKDLDQEWFTNKTDFSDDLIPIKGVNYDHLPFWSDNPYASRVLKTKLIGSAKFVESTEEGRWYEVEVSKAEAYHEYLIKLAEKGLLGASTQAMPGSVTVLATGEITDWAETGMALTVHPANPDTLNNVNELAKTMKIPLYPEIEKSLEEKAVADTLAAKTAEEEEAKKKTDADKGKENEDGAPPPAQVIEIEGLVEDVKAAAVKAVTEALESPLKAIDDIVTALSAAIKGIETLTENEDFKSLTTDLMPKLDKVNKSLGAVTYLIAKTSAQANTMPLPGQSKSKGEDDQEEEGSPEKNKNKQQSYLPESFN